MIIVNDFLPDYYADLIEETMSGTFPWYFLENASGESSESNDKLYPEYQFGFFHNIFIETHGGPSSNYYDLFLPMIYALEKRFNIKDFFVKRIRLGMSTNIGIEGARYPHVDAQEPHKTFLYYVNSSDGDTLFYNKSYPESKENLIIEKRNTPKKNTGILFDGLKYHSSSFPTKQSRRMTININFTGEIQ